MRRALRETLPLSQLRDGTYVLRAAPSIVCYESYEHNVMTGISILALIVYVFGGCPVPPRFNEALLQNLQNLSRCLPALPSL